MSSEPAANPSDPGDCPGVGDVPDPGAGTASPSEPLPESDRGQAHRRLQRGSDRVIAGVCSGLADYLGVDVTIIRLVALLFALMGHGILLYVAAWLLMPTADGGPSVWDRRRARRRPGPVIAA